MHSNGAFGTFRPLSQTFSSFHPCQTCLRYSFSSLQCVSPEKKKTTHQNAFNHLLGLVSSNNVIMSFMCLVGSPKVNRFGVKIQTHTWPVGQCTNVNEMVHRLLKGRGCGNCRNKVCEEFGDTISLPQRRFRRSIRQVVLIFKKGGG